ncbi:TetR family transcriptional regulator [Bacillus glycinifermentans]|uniref:TetR family transcriptional regulator n=1 Tax=Bacillus glycinifermentans TaxID=1664069 RepID=A0A0J6DWP3_9BACI|nr:TetR family transcriptional regulator [Bacillus glycinifermentans]ATH94765.1 TetR/AcrR family transcriptional regulator [Bacillus glycinifermentans]KMM52891.1 TetR family transcriptional regulator [Bacillus glycinifermentans]KRT92048.1 TetR family transcriptional regulator [Bacillus glycinifermentans]MEC0486498.1 TetR family transcriptional regulator [Bacillus glycinifermentans]MEC0494145.1 TetR family transcriptional regulator [Bacillus glycinifermentans]
MSPKITQEQKDRRKAEILKAAERVFKRKGFEMTTMKDIVEESGFSRGGVYLYFSSTEDMFKHIIEEHLDVFLTDLQERSKSDESVWSIILSYIDDFKEGLDEIADSFAAVQFEYFFTSWRNGSRKTYLTKRYETFAAHFTELLQKGADNGEFDPLQPIETITKFFMNMNDAIVMQTIYLGKAEADALGQIEALKHYLTSVLQVR